MKLFGWKSAGRNVARPATGLVPLARTYAALGMGQWPQSYEAQLREGYLHNAIAQRAVRLVAEGLASAPLRASDDKARALVLATSGGQALLETLAGQLLLHGNGYVQVLSDSDGRPCELYALRPERVSIEADARGWPAAFRYRVGETVTRLAANEVIHIRSHHPLDDHYGLGCLGAASGAIAVHNASAKWNKALLDNAARPSGALVAGAGEPMTGEQFARLKQELADGFQGAANAGRPMLLEGGLNWQSISLSPADMDFAGLKSAAAREIALAFGVPPMLLGLPGDATYANYREANKALWRQTILPLAGKMLDAIAEGLAVHFPALELSIDLDQLSALSEERERLWAQLGAADFLTLNEKREAIGLEAVKLDAGEEEEEEEEESEPDDSQDREEADDETENPTETKFNPWHDPDDGQFTFAGQGVRSSGDNDLTAKATDNSKRTPREAGSSSKGTAKPKKGGLERHFSSSTPPTIANAISQIKASSFGKTKAGRFVVDKIERLNKAGKISIADLVDRNGRRQRGRRTADGIFIDGLMADHVSKLASELVHEATHDLLSDEYVRTGRRPNANSIDQEALTNGYQLRLYREQRKYGFKDKELERRLKESDAGKLRANIRKRYVGTPEQQPKN